MLHQSKARAFMQVDESLHSATTVILSGGDFPVYQSLSKYIYFLNVKSKVLQDYLSGKRLSVGSSGNLSQNRLSGGPSEDYGVTCWA